MSRYHDGYVAWTKGHQIVKERCGGFQTVEGNGFGCVMLRSNVLKESLFTCRQHPFDFDPSYYEQLEGSRFQAKLCWDVECEHLGGTKIPHEQGWHPQTSPERIQLGQISLRKQEHPPVRSVWKRGSFCFESSLPNVLTRMKFSRHEWGGHDQKSLHQTKPELR